MIGIITRSSHLSVHTLTSARGQVIHNLPASQIFFPTKYCISVREHLLQRQKMRFRQICAVKTMHKCGLNYALMHKSSLTKLVSTLLQLLLSNSVSVLVMVSSSLINGDLTWEKTRTGPIRRIIAFLIFIFCSNYLTEDGCFCRKSIN